MDALAKPAPAEPDPLAAAPRNLGIDVARGLLMAWIVIAVHGVFWLGLAPRGPASLMLFEMPPIFMITGAAYFLGEGKKEGRLKPGNYFDYLLRRGVRVYVPYLAYALVAMLIVLLGPRFGQVTFGEALGAFGSWINPISRGAGHTWLTLSWHLWFMAPFLAVTALMPLIAPRKVGEAPPLWLMAITGGVVAFAVAQLDFPNDDVVQNIVFYALWAVFGYMLAAATSRFRIADYAVVLMLAVALMWLAAQLCPQSVTLDMQRNKFPPNGVFWLFSCAWIAVFMIALRFFDDARIASLARSPLLKPWISAGYSIYLWQGVGYAAALYFGRLWGWSIWAMWPVAVALTVALGMLAAPLERIRLPKRKL